MSRLGRVITVLSANRVDGSLISGICATAVEMIEADAAGLALFSDSLTSALCVRGHMAEVGEQLQFTLGEGPCRDALATHVLVEAAQLSTDSRWPMFVSGMAETRVQSVASFPVRIGGARLGALTVYRDEPGRLSSDQAANGYVLAQVAAHVIVAAQANVVGDGYIDELEAGFVRMEPVHQATGMIMGQLGVTAEEALARLRGAAFAAGQPITQTARDVIDGHLLLAEDKST